MDAHQGGAAPGEPAAAAGRRVLVVEDDAATATVWEQALADEGYAVRTRDSARGVAALLRAWRPGAVLLDLGLPDRSGACLLAALKADPATAAIPVGVVSGTPEALPPADRGLAAAVLPKPFDLEQALAVVAALWSAPPRHPPTVERAVPGRSRSRSGRTPTRRR